MALFSTSPVHCKWGGRGPPVFALSFSLCPFFPQLYGVNLRRMGKAVVLSSGAISWYTQIGAVAHHAKLGGASPMIEGVRD